MTSGPSDNESSPMLGSHVTDPWLARLQNAYAGCDVAILVVDDNDEAIFANDLARELLPDEHREDIGELELGDGEYLSDLVDRTRTGGLGVRTWQGPVHIHDSPRLRIHLTRLPNSAKHVLCQLRPTREPNDAARAQLIAKLTDHPERNQDLDSAGRAVVDILSTHLETSVVAGYFDNDDLADTWSCGDSRRCTDLDELVRSFAPAAENTLHCEHDEAADAMVLAFRLPGDSAVVIFVDLDTPWAAIPVSCPFWRCLAAAAKNSFQSARLAELNRQERLRLRAVIEHMPIAVMLFDVEGRVLDLNLRARAMAGRRTWERIGDEDYPFRVCDVDGTTLPREQWPLIRAVERGICCEEEEYVIDFGDSQRTISITVVPITDDHDRVTSYLATGRDVTRRSEEDKRKDEFLSIASHELRSPLTPLAGFVQLSRQQAESQKPVDADVLKRAEYQIRRLQRLIDGLLDYTRLETGKLPVHRKYVEMTRLVGRIMRPWLEGPHHDRVRLSLPDETVEAYVDPDRIDQVLTNVVDNAIKHGREGGTVEVDFRLREDRVVLTVADEGDGIPEEVIQQVFECYFHSPNGESSGTGLGLYIARQIVEDHGGTIEIDSGRSHPTTVTISLPVDEGK